MKRILIIMAVMAVSLSASAKVVEKTFTVRGHCGMCKSNIEKVSKGFEGVQSAEYDLQGQTLKLVFDKKTVKVKDVQKAIAELGYDAGKVKASDEAYEKLPGCCRYREIEGVSDHHMDGSGHDHHHAE